MFYFDTNFDIAIVINNEIWHYSHICIIITNSDWFFSLVGMDILYLPFGGSLFNFLVARLPLLQNFINWVKSFFDSSSYEIEQFLIT